MACYGFFGQEQRESLDLQYTSTIIYSDTAGIVLYFIGTYLTPARFNLIGFRSDFIDFCRHQGFCHLVGTPLLDRAHGLRIEFIHSSSFFLYMCDNRNVRNASLHERLCQDSMRSIGIGVGSTWWRCTWLPSSFFALRDILFDCIREFCS
jgi:hypothetical protein